MSIVARMRRLTEEHGHLDEHRWYTEAHRYLLGEDVEELLRLPYDHSAWTAWQPRLPYDLVGVHFFREDPSRERAIFLRSDGAARLVMNINGSAVTVLGAWHPDRTFVACLLASLDDGEPSRDVLAEDDLVTAFRHNLGVAQFFLFMRERGPQVIRRATRRAEDDALGSPSPGHSMAAAAPRGRTIVLPSIRVLYEGHGMRVSRRTPAPHDRAGHIRRFRAPRYTHARGRTIWVKPMKVLGGSAHVGGVIDVVRFDPSRVPGSSA